MWFDVRVEFTRPQFVDIFRIRFYDTVTLDSYRKHGPLFHNLKITTFLIFGKRFKTWFWCKNTFMCSKTVVV